MNVAVNNELEDQEFLEWAMQKQLLEDLEVERENEAFMWEQMSQETEDEFLHEEQTWELIEAMNKKKPGIKPALNSSDIQPVFLKF